MIEAYLPLILEVAVGFATTIIVLCRKIDRIEVRQDKQDIRIEKIEDKISCQIPKTQKS